MRHPAQVLVLCLTLLLVTFSPPVDAAPPDAPDAVEACAALGGDPPLETITITNHAAPTALDAMAYCDANDVILAYRTSMLGELTGFRGGGDIDREKLDLAVADFGDELELAVRSQHPDNPFDRTHAYLRGLNVKGAFLTLAERSPGGLSEAQLVQWKMLHGAIRDIRAGEVDLVTDAQKADPQPTLDPVTLVQHRKRVMGRHRPFRA